jgi:DNA-binding NtrC family response regulator
MSTILVVDDELGIRALLSEILGDEGHAVEVAENAAQARAARDRARPDLVLLDIWMPDVDGITLLKEWRARALLTMPVIMMSGHGTVDTETEAIRHGAVGFLEKPITLQRLLKAVEHALHPMAARAAAGREAALPKRQAVVWPQSPQPAAPAVNPPPMPMAPVGPSPRQSFDLDLPLREARDAFEKGYFEFHLACEGGSMTRVADKTGLERTHLYRKLKQLGVDLSRGRKPGTPAETPPEVVRPDDNGLD